MKNIVKEAMKTFKLFNKWFETLSPLDQMNFKTLISLPTGGKVIADMPPGKYKDMATFAWGFKHGKTLRKKK